MSVFDKLIVGIKRKLGGKKINIVSEEKDFGTFAEEKVVKRIKLELPAAIVKSNVILYENGDSCEIDCIVQYENKIFIIEIKHWKGIIIEEKDCFIKKKEDKYTNDIYIKQMTSPFKQVKRQIMMLKATTKTILWVNPIVLFVDSDKVICKSNNVWFDNIKDLINYIMYNGKRSNQEQINKCISQVKCSDYIYSSSLFGNRYLHCNILDHSLKFKTNKRIVSRDEIKQINIKHHFTYDELSILLTGGYYLTINIENGNIDIIENGRNNYYSLSKIDQIILGK